MPGSRAQRSLLKWLIGKRVLLVERRPHVAGNACDLLDAAGVLIHRYGPHIVHTNFAAVFGFLSQFTQWRDYQHRVLASFAGQLVPIPINLDTVNSLHGLNLSEDELQPYLASISGPQSLCPQVGQLLIH